MERHAYDSQAVTDLGREIGEALDAGQPITRHGSTVARNEQGLITVDGTQLFNGGYYSAAYMILNKDDR